MLEYDSTFNDLQPTTTMKKIFSGTIVLLVSCFLISLTSCDRLLSVDTDRFLRSDEVLLNSPNDTVFSILGILAKMQKLADRTVLTGELRADLMDVTVNTSNEVRDLNNYTIDSLTSPFSDVRDYYAIINNCNYFIRKADTMVTVRGERVFKKEISTAKTIRAWTYLQLGLNHGEATYYSDPILSVEDLTKVHPLLNPTQLIDSLINEMELMDPINNTAIPQYGTINNVTSRYLFVNPLFLLGDLYLWKASQTHNTADYERSAFYYGKLIEMNKYVANSNGITWRDATYTGWNDSWTSALTNTSSSTEWISLLKLVTSPYDGTASKIGTMCTNFELCASPVYLNNSNNQTYCFREGTGTIKLSSGDLRAKSLLKTTIINTYTNESQVLINKYADNVYSIYRVALLYLRYAEAVNRSGKPNLAFAVLKYGLNSSTLSLVDRVPANELVDQKPYVTFFRGDDYTNNAGIHSRGSGSSMYNTMYFIPNYTRQVLVNNVWTNSTDSLDLVAAKNDTINFVESAICDELALETPFEGNRFQDLMRMSDNREDPKFLATKVAQKHSMNYDYYFNLLKERKNWYIKPH